MLTEGEKLREHPVFSSNHFRSHHLTASQSMNFLLGLFWYCFIDRAQHEKCTHEGPLELATWQGVARKMPRPRRTNLIINENIIIIKIYKYVNLKTCLFNFQLFRFFRWTSL